MGICPGKIKREKNRQLPVQETFPFLKNKIESCRELSVLLPVYGDLSLDNAADLPGYL